MRMAKAVVVATAVALLAAVSSGGSSSGDQVWVLADTASNRQHATYLQMLGLAAVEDAVRIRVYAEHLEEAADYLRLMGVSWEVCIEDVSQYLQNVTSRRRRRDSLPYPSPRFPCTLDYCPEPLVHRWMSYEEITSFVLSVNSTHFERARTTSVGRTAEGRDIWMVTVHKGTCDDSRGFYIVAGSEARERMGPAVALNLVWRLIYDCEVGEGHSFYILPLLNPDGYEYSRTSGDEMWVKNRANITGSSCWGVNLDRNFDFEWGTAGSATEPCSEVFNGGSPMSELESQALDRALGRCLAINMVMSLSSSRGVGGEAILYPWSFTADEAPNNLTRILNYAETFRNASFHVHGTNHSLAAASAAPAPHSGTFTDWAMSVHKAAMAFVVRLRGDGSYSNNPDDILATAEEFWAGIYALCTQIAADFP